MPDQWQLLGFDAREDSQDCRKSPIPSEVREELLLRPEVECPLSVDSHIWPSHFLFHPQIRHLIGEGQPILIEADSDCRGGLWPNLVRMQQRLLENHRSAVLIAIEVLMPDAASFAEFQWDLVSSKKKPSVVPDGSVLLGFDVADAAFLSGLSNCAYSEEERQRLRPEWQTRVNDLGLLTSTEDGIKFKEISNTRVPEHAPFWVYRLHRLN